MCTKVIKNGNHQKQIKYGLYKENIPGRQSDMVYIPVAVPDFHRGSI
jgi:hypothetical protein